MPPLESRLDMLSKAPRVAQAGILREALTHALPVERALIARRLIALEDPAGTAAAIRLAETHPELREDLRGCQPELLSAAVRRIVSADHAAGIGSSIAVVQAHPDPATAIELLPVLESQHTHLRQLVAQATLDVTVAIVGPTGRRNAGLPSLAALDELLARALLRFDQHRMKDVLVAVAIAHRQAGRELSALLEHIGTPARFAVQGVARQFDHELVALNLIRWLSSDLLGRQAAAALHRVKDPQLRSAMLQKGYLLLSGRRRRTMRHVDHAPRCLIEIAEAVDLPQSAQRFLPRYIFALPITTSRRASYLLDLIALPSPIARWRAVETLMGYRTTDAATALRRFSRDREPSIAAVAASHLLQQLPGATPAAIETLKHCTNRLQDRRVMCSRAAHGRVQLHVALESLPRHALVAAARRLRLTDPAFLLRQLSTLLQSGTRDLCLPALFIVRRLQLTSGIQPLLLELADADDPQISSAAVSALADAPTSPSVETIRRMLHHQHDRVRANAIDAMSAVHRKRPGSDRAATLVEVLIPPHALSRHNRERANALRAWLRHAPTGQQALLATDRLRDMLYDHDPMHRISAIWVAGRSRRVELADELSDLARNEPASPVRQRAATALRRLPAQPVEVAARGASLIV